MIRPLSVDDAPRIAEIEQREQIKPLLERTIYNWFTNGYLGWGLETDNWLYGYTIASPITNGQTHSVITCIAREYQNKKEGRQLCWHALQELKRMGANNVVFEVRRSNIAELSMVKHFGAFVINEIPGYYGNEDALVMQINLEELRNE